MVRHVLVTYLCVSVDRYRELWEEGESAGKRKRRGKAARRARRWSSSFRRVGE
jgi:hypothetical protein